MKTKTNGLRRKLASRRGTSITFALLLFLICAVIGVIVLVAGTAAAGRTSRLVEADQRYFAVNSAAQFLREEIEGSSVTVSRKRTVTGSYGSYILVWEEEIENQETHEMEVTQKSSEPTNFVNLTYLYEYTITPPEPNSSLPFLKDAACYYVFNKTAAEIAGLAEAEKPALWTQEVEYNRGAVALLPENETETIRLRLKDDTGATAPEPVNLSVTLMLNGELQVQVWQTDAKSKETYRVTMVFSASHSELFSNTDTVFPNNTNTDLSTLRGNAAAEVIEFPVNDIGSKDDTFTWTLAELKKG